MAADAAPGGAQRASPAASDRSASAWSRVALLVGGTGRSVGALVLLALTALLLAGGPDAPLRGLWFDFCQRLAPRVRVSGPAVIVAVDEPSLGRYGQWPWPRQLLAELVDRLRGASPAAVALNFLFPEADGFSGASLATRIPGLAARTAAWVASVPDGDQALGRALAAAPSVIGLAGLDGPVALSRRGHFTPVVVRGKDPSGQVRHFRTALHSVSDIDGGAAGHALLSADVTGGVVRRLPLVAAVGDTLVPGLGIEVLRVAAGAPAFGVRSDGGGVRAVGVGDVWIPAESDGTMWIHFTPHDPARFVSAAAVLAGEIAPERLERKLVLVGVTALGLGDQHVTPLGESLPGVEIHAQALENMFDGPSSCGRAGRRKSRQRPSSWPGRSWSPSPR